MNRLLATITIVLAMAGCRATPQSSSQVAEASPAADNQHLTVIWYSRTADELVVNVTSTCTDDAQLKLEVSGGSPKIVTIVPAGGASACAARNVDSRLFTFALGPVGLEGVPFALTNPFPEKAKELTAAKNVTLKDRNGNEISMQQVLDKDVTILLFGDDDAYTWEAARFARSLENNTSLTRCGIAMIGSKESIATISQWPNLPKRLFSVSTPIGKVGKLFVDGFGGTPTFAAVDRVGNTLRTGIGSAFGPDVVKKLCQ